jgi:predicted nucleic acid-binding protein
MRALLDVNALIAFLDPSNANHSKIARWMRSFSAEGWASCPLTENACLRVLTNPRVRGCGEGHLVTL